MEAVARPRAAVVDAARALDVFQLILCTDRSSIVKGMGVRDHCLGEVGSRWVGRVESYQNVRVMMVGVFGGGEGEVL